MSVNEFTSVLGKRILENVILAVQNRRDLTKSLDAKDVLRPALEKGSQGNTGVISIDAFSILAKQFKDKSNTFYVQTTKGSEVSIADSPELLKIAERAASLLENFRMVDADISKPTFSKWLVEKKNYYPRNKEATGTANKVLDLKLDGRKTEARLYDTEAVFKNLNHSQLRVLVIQYLKETHPSESNYKNTSGISVIDFINVNLQAGHLAGVLTLRLRNLLGADYNNSRDAYLNRVTGSLSASVDSITDGIMKSVISLDELTSNLSVTSELWAIARKNMTSATSPSATIELQFSTLNNKAGAQVRAIGEAISKIEKDVNNIVSFKLRDFRQKAEQDAKQEVQKVISNIRTKEYKEAVAATYEEMLKDLIQKDLYDAVYAELNKLEQDKRLSKVLDSLRAAMIQSRWMIRKVVRDTTITQELRAHLIKTLNSVKTGQELLGARGSPSILEFIQLNVASIIKTGKNIINPGNTVTPKVTKNTKNNSIQEAIDSVKKAIDSVRSSKTKTSIKPSKTKPSKTREHTVKVGTSSSSSAVRPTNLVHLQTLLNSQLADQIKRNMKKPALVNRTGRFAESAKVERLSESRAGMITAFYSYMKNPYQTFQPGFLQGSEKRNPKTLISKSIREIASTIVGNRLRSVSI
jgi:hypothetical protein